LEEGEVVIGFLVAAGRDPAVRRFARTATFIPAKPAAAESPVTNSEHSAAVL